MAVIAEVIAGVIEGLGNTISSGIDKADKQFSARYLQGQKQRNNSSFIRTLPVMIVAVVIVVVLVFLMNKK